MEIFEIHPQLTYAHPPLSDYKVEIIFELVLYKVSRSESLKHSSNTLSYFLETIYICIKRSPFFAFSGADFVFTGVLSDNTGKFI